MNYVTIFKISRIFTYQLNETTMKRQSIMDTNKEIKAAYSINYDGYEAPVNGKAYQIGTDDNGIMIVSMDFRDMRGLSDVHTIIAQDSQQARVRYNSIKSI